MKVRVNEKYGKRKVRVKDQKEPVRSGSEYFYEWIGKEANTFGCFWTQAVNSLSSCMVAIDRGTFDPIKIDLWCSVLTTKLWPDGTENHFWKTRNRSIWVERDGDYNITVPVFYGIIQHDYLDDGSYLFWALRDKLIQKFVSKKVATPTLITTVRYVVELVRT